MSADSEYSRNIRGFLKATLIARSPLHIGNGIDDITDSDLLLGSDNKPYLPGSTIAGCARHYLEQLGADALDFDPRELFGFEPAKQVEGCVKEQKGQRSSITFFDAPLCGEARVAVRDSVRIKEDGTAADDAKFDYEVLESGSRFDLRVGVSAEDDAAAQNVFKVLLDGIDNGDICFGAKTARGLGRFSVERDSVACRTIDLSNHLDEYIHFSWDDVTDSFLLAGGSSRLYESLVVTFIIESFTLVRNYATLINDEDNSNKVVDSAQLVNADGKAVIPGTSWAGVFRHHAERIMKKAGYLDDTGRTCMLNKVFGHVERSARSKSPSQIMFSESVIENQNIHKRTRNAIDRFTGGAADKKLFTSAPSFGGSTQLEIRLVKGCEEAELVKSLIDTCLIDIHEGFLNIGGEGSVGGGLLSIQERGKWQ